MATRGSAGTGAATRAPRARTRSRRPRPGLDWHRTVGVPTDDPGGRSEMGVIIIREMVGTSPTSWSDAARRAVATASRTCLLYTSDAADDLTRVDLGGRRIIKKKKKKTHKHQ